MLDNELFTLALLKKNKNSENNSDRLQLPIVEVT
jgi:hypothetical protein